MYQDPQDFHQYLYEKHGAATIILAGGEGTRLFPLTKKRCKPDVSFGGRYRLIDIPISNSINAKISNIFIISQHFVKGLNRHIQSTFVTNSQIRGNIKVLSPEQSAVQKVLYKGTADSVRQNLSVFSKLDVDYFIILSGDQLYNMDLLDMLTFAKSMDAELTIATTPIQERDAKRMGIMQIDHDHWIKDFVEKPKEPNLLNKFKTSQTEDEKRPFLGSMGIYIFKKHTLEKLLKEDQGEDFGHHIIPRQITKGEKTAAYIYKGYWEDIGTIESFYEANLALTTNSSSLDLYSEDNPIYAESTNLPSARLKDTMVKNSIICDGCLIEAEEITHSLIGVRSKIKKGTIIQDSIIIGNPSYHPKQKKNHKDFYIGENCLIKKAIIDEQTILEDDVQLINHDKLSHFDSDFLYVRNGIIVVPNGSKLEKGFRF